MLPSSSVSLYLSTGPWNSSKSEMLFSDFSHLREEEKYKNESGLRPTFLLPKSESISTQLILNALSRVKTDFQT